MAKQTLEVPADARVHRYQVRGLAWAYILVTILPCWGIVVIGEIVSFAVITNYGYDSVFEFVSLFVIVSLLVIGGSFVIAAIYSVSRPVRSFAAGMQAQNFWGINRTVRWEDLRYSWRISLLGIAYLRLRDATHGTAFYLYLPMADDPAFRAAVMEHHPDLALRLWHDQEAYGR